MAASGAEEQKLKVAQACEAGDQFIKLFYETYDKRRHMLGKLYLDTATLVWNGTPVSGQQEIIKFLENLPSSQHTVESLDAQPIASSVTQGQTSILVTTGGIVKFQGNPLQNFRQSFMLTTQNNSWKVATDDVRINA